MLSLSFIVYVAELGSVSFVSARLSANFVFFSSVAPASCAHKVNAFKCKLFFNKYFFISSSLDINREGWKLLFDGEKIRGWRPYESPTKEIKGWTIDNGTLHKPSKVRAGNIMTMKTYEDFEFSWEWKLESKGNNGVKYFITE